MIVRYSPGLLSQLKKVNIRVQKRFKERIAIFIKDPFNPQLNNHLLKDEWDGYRSIDLTNDWRAIYEELKEGEDMVGYFIAIGIHKDLYGS